MFRLPGITQPACTGRQLPITRLGLSDGPRKQKPEPTDFHGKSIKQFHPPCSGAISPTPNAAAEFAADPMESNSNRARETTSHHAQMRYTDRRDIVVYAGFRQISSRIRRYPRYTIHNRVSPQPPSANCFSARRRMGANMDSHQD